MRKENTVALKTMAIKARVYNQIRKDLYQKVLEEGYASKYRGYEILSDEKKLELFNKWFSLNSDSHHELNSYKRKRKDKAAIEAKRASKIKENA